MQTTESRARFVLLDNTILLVERKSEMNARFISNINGNYKYLYGHCTVDVIIIFFLFFFKYITSIIDGDIFFSTKRYV